VPYQPTARTRAKQADTRRRILEAARSLVAEGGYGAAQVADVARAASVGTGTVYRYFPSKGELFAEVFRRASQREVDVMAEAAAAPGPVRERLAEATRVFARRALRGRRMAYALIAEPVDEAVDAERILYRQAYARVLEALIAEAVADGACAPADPAITAAFLVGGLAEALVGPLAPDAAAADAEHLIETIIDAAERAVFGDAP
jgi:AcrR family transcriptional regulator